MPSLGAGAAIFFTRDGRWAPLSLSTSLSGSVPHRAYQIGLLDFVVACDERQSGNTGLGDDHAIVRIFDAHERRRLKEELCIVDTEVEVIRLREGDDQVPKRYGQSDLAAFGEQHQFFEHGERHQNRIDSSLDPLEDGPRAPAQAGFPADEM